MIEFTDIHTPGQLAEVYKAMEETNHPYIPANMAIYRDNQLIGALAVNSVPLVQAFLDPRHADALDSIRTIKHSDKVAKQFKYRSYMILCTKDSPFHPHMERLGFVPMGSADVFKREVP